MENKIFIHQNNLVKKNNRPKKYMTKFRKKTKKNVDRKIRKNMFARALADCARGRFSSITKCAAFYKVPYSTLYTLFTTGAEYKGSGGANKVLTLVEEAKIVTHVK